MDHRDTRPSSDRRDQRDPRDRRGAGPNKKKRKKHGRGFRVVMTVVLILVITLAMLLCMAAVYIKNVIIPEAGLEMADFNPNLTSTMLYQDPDTGSYVTMQTLHGDENRVWVDLSEIPKNLQNAAVAIEDKRFYDHGGVDWVRTAKAILLMFTGGDIQGGSTITQQLIKNMTDDDEVTVKRKVMEIFRALEFEKNYSKEDILEAYLNYIYLGQGCNGVYTAAYTYFGKHVSELSLAECASLIGITNNPSKYDPMSNREIKTADGQTKSTREYNKERQELILQAMLEQKMISQEEYDQAVAEELDFLEPGEATDIPGATNNTVYSWYEDQVINDVIDDLVETYGWSETYAKDKVFSGGLEIYTCMNPNVQAAVDKVYQDRSNLNATSSSGQEIQSAITIVDNETGRVVAMAGGMGEKTVSRGLNRATSSKRPPGSSIKPLAVYAPAIELGKVTPLTSVEDSPYGEVDGRAWPVNATGRYQGDVTVAHAVEESINTVAVKVLDMVTPETSFDFMQDKFHVELVRAYTKNNMTYSDINLASLALGGLTEGLTTYEMAAAYSVFPRQGTYIEPTTYTMVVDSNDQILLRSETEEEGETVLSERTAYYITEMLQNVVTGTHGATGKNANFSGQEIAGKTGTTTSRKDLWFVGYTPYYTAAVWTGYDQQERLAGYLGNPSTGLWQKVMSEVHKTLAYKDFDQPSQSDLRTVRYCMSSGMLATSACGSNVATGTFYADDVPTSSCTYHRVTVPTTDPDTGATGDETGDNTDSGTTDPGTDPGTDTPPTTDPGTDPTTPPAEGGTETTGRRRRNYALRPVS
ncbi:MAG TPA: PBP1A family penicillin-binding protein [Candidatus Evtepia faecavium]|nr:PBP1A family penicillin-binding protein [Candidatus Evtepia faecavium]